MEINKFIEVFAELFDEVEANDLSKATEFSNLDEWDSIVALSAITLIDEEYDVVLDGDDIEDSITIENLFNLVKSKL